MRLLSELRERLRTLFLRGRVEREMDEELRFHVEMQTEANVSAGMDPREARRRALLKLGGVEQTKEQVREAGGVRWLEDLFRDVSHAVRTITARPGTAGMAVLTLALGIGATTAIFSVLRAVVLNPLPFPEPDALVVVSELTPQGDEFSMSEPTYLDFREGSRSFEHLGAIAGREVALLGQGDPVRLDALAVTPNYFAMLGAEAAFGRTFDRTEAESERAVAVLSHRLWRDRFGADPAIVGRAVDLDGSPVVVVGVMPRGWRAPTDPELWVPLAPRAHAEREDHVLSVFGRLASGVGIAQAEADLRAVADRLGREHPETNGGWSVRVEPLRDRLIGADVTRTVWILMGAVGLLLLLTCANVGHLLIARAADRRREVGLRSALGAGRGRIARQFLTESLVLAVLGAAAGFALAWAGVPLLKTLTPADTPRIDEVRVDGVVLAFTVAVATLTSLLFGLAPAVQASRVDVRAVLTDGARGGSERGSRMRDLLVVGEVAAAVTLLIGAGLLATSFSRLQRVDTGMAVADVLTVPLSLSSQGYSSDELGRFYEDVEDRIAALPGVVAVGGTGVTPLSGSGTVATLSVEGRPSGPGETEFARWRAVTPGFFDAAGLTLLRGRTLERSDFASGAADVIVVTSAFADRIFPDGDPVGRRVAMGVNGTNWRRIVGVVEDVRDIRLAESPQPLFFLPGTGWPWMTLLVKTAGDPSQVAGALRDAIWDVDPTVTVPVVEPFDARIGRAVAGPRFNMLLIGAFAAAALVLALVGVYGIVSHLVGRRTREIGIRMALGGLPGSVLWLVFRRGAGLTLAGVAVGTIAALGLTRFLGTMLFRTPAVEPATFAAAVGLMCLVGFAAAGLPARRATRVDPMIALRHE